MQEAKREIMSIRRIGANLFSSIDAEQNPLTRKKVKASQFKGEIFLMAYKSITFSIDVTGLKLPLKYSFTGSSTAGDFYIYFS
jgi:hypothetical protein